MLAHFCLWPHLLTVIFFFPTGFAVTGSLSHDSSSLADLYLLLSHKQGSNTSPFGLFHHLFLSTCLQVTFSVPSHISPATHGTPLLLDSPVCNRPLQFFLSFPTFFLISMQQTPLLLSGRTGGVFFALMGSSSPITTLNVGGFCLFFLFHLKPRIIKHSLPFYH
jgi:hypothetical protein